MDKRIVKQDFNYRVDQFF